MPLRRVTDGQMDRCTDTIIANAVLHYTVWPKLAEKWAKCLNEFLKFNL